MHLSGLWLVHIKGDQKQYVEDKDAPEVCYIYGVRPNLSSEIYAIIARAEINLMKDYVNHIYKLRQSSSPPLASFSLPNIEDCGQLRHRS